MPRPSVYASPTLAPIKSKTMPERLRIDNIKPTPVKPSEIQPPSPSEAPLAPLKVTKTKQNSVVVTPQYPGTSSPSEGGTPDIESGKQWARKVKLKADPLTPSPVGFVSFYELSPKCYQ